MAGVNLVIILGNLGNDPEMRYMPNGEPVANISIATSETWNDKNTGEKREKTEWHRVVAYRRTAEMKQEIQRIAPLQAQLAAELADGGIKSSLHTVRQDYPGVQAVSRDGWILLRTPRFG